MPSFRRSSCALCAFALASGCASAPESPVLPPRLRPELTYYVGSVLSGPLPASEAPAVAKDPADALTVRLRIFFLPRAPEGDTGPLSLHTKLVVGNSGPRPVQAASYLTEGARIATGDPGRRLLRWLESERSGAEMLFDERGVLPASVTSWFQIEALSPVEVPDGGPVHRRIGVLLSRAESDEPITVAISIAGNAESIPPSIEELELDPEQSPPPAGVMRRELVVLDDSPEIDGPAMLYVVPSVFDPTGRSFVVGVLEVGTVAPGTVQAAGHAAEVAACLRSLAIEQETIVAETEPLPPDRFLQRELAAAYQSLSDAANRRAALVYLAASTGAWLAEDIALVGSDDVLGEYLDSVLTASSLAEVQEADAQAVGWLLEGKAYRYLLPFLEERSLRPGLFGVLMRHAGEVASYPMALEEIVEKSRGVTELERKLVSWNIDFLEDTGPGTRVRAYDWLSVRGLAPKEYDPLASADARRAALERQQSAEAEGKGRR